MHTYEPDDESARILFDLLGQRWTLRILWALRHGRLNFRELRSECEDVSPTLLSQRLKLLRETGFLEHDKSGYGYTFWGYQMLDHMRIIAKWSEDWVTDNIPDE